MNKYFMAFVVLINENTHKYTYDHLFMCVDKYSTAKKQAYNVVCKEFPNLCIREIIVYDMLEQIDIMKTMQKEINEK